VEKVLYPGPAPRPETPDVRSTGGGSLRVQRVRLRMTGMCSGRQSGRGCEVVPGKPVAARGLVNGWMALAPDGMERSGRFSRYHLTTP